MFQDLERTQALPNVRVLNNFDGDTVEVSNEYHLLRIRLDAINCPEIEFSHWSSGQSNALCLSAEYGPKIRGFKSVPF